MKAPARESPDVGSQSKAPAIARAAAILRLLGKQDAPMSLKSIAGETGLVPSTCLYVLRALAEEELVAIDRDTKRYALAGGVLTLARQWLAKDEFSACVQTELDRLSQQFGITSLGVQIFGHEHIVVVANASSGNSFQISARVGSRFPALISATGRCIAAWSELPPEDFAERIAKLRWDNPPRFDDWLKQVRAARTNGYALDDGNYISGIKVLAAPVWTTSGVPSHAIVALGIASALKAPDAKRLGKALDAAARTLSRQLGG